MLSKYIPIRMARIEFGDGGFHVSHYQDVSTAFELPDSGGACFACWSECKDDNLLVAWCYWHALMAIRDGAGVDHVFRELDKIAECRTFHIEVASDPIGWGEEQRAREARDAT
jgi:hypothetical protein